MDNIIYLIVIYPLLYILPAYVANGSPVVFGGGAPLDFGRKLWGKPIFGSHKTIRGLVFGLASGFVVAAVEAFLLHNYLQLAMETILGIGILLSIGAHAGDLFGSFVKRRLDKKEGHSWAFFDQYLFLIFAILFALPLGNLPNVFGIVFIVIITGLLHRGTNMLAHKAKIKEVPW